MFRKKPAMVLWLVEHRGQLNLEIADVIRWTALHHASAYGLLAIVEALVAAGANPAAADGLGSTPLIDASDNGHTDIVAFLLQLPAAKAGIDAINHHHYTALSSASSYGNQPIVQLLLDAGADPIVPPGEHSPLQQALRYKHYEGAALLCHAITEAERARALALHKVRSLLGAGAASRACLLGRVEQGNAPPRPEFPRRGRSGNEKLRATAAFAVGVSGGEKDTGMCEDLYLKLLGYMLPAWADKGPDA